VTPRPVTNIGASVRQRLLNLARERGEPFDQLLQYYAIERFLARLATTPWADVLVVKGATLLRVWNAPLARPTRDIDFHTRLSDGAAVARVAVAEVVALEQDDGLVFERDIASEPIVVDGRYPGVRLAVKGSLAGARFKLQVDVGVGTEVVPEPAWVDYPVLLAMDQPRVLAYAPETAIAEKFEAMVSLGEANGRLRDFYDVWLLAATLAFGGRPLSAAVAATFSGLGTTLPAAAPVTLTDSFAALPEAQARWAAFVAQPGVSGPASFVDATCLIAAFLMPVVEAVRAGRGFDAQWSPGGPWATTGRSETTSATGARVRRNR